LRIERREFFEFVLAEIPAIIAAINHLARDFDFVFILSSEKFSTKPTTFS